MVEDVVSIEWEGLEAVKRMFTRAKRYIERGVSEAFAEIGRDVKERARARVHVVTGLLRGSIQFVQPRPSEIIFKTVHYGVIEEFRPGVRKTPPHTPHAFLRPTIEERMHFIKQEIKRHIEHEFELAKRGI